MTWGFKVDWKGSRKDINGLNFYKVLLGERSLFLSREGIDVLRQARSANVPMGHVSNAINAFSFESGLASIERIRKRIETELAGIIADSISYEPLTKGALGILAMCKEAGVSAKVFRDIEHLLHMVSEPELREFYDKEKELMDEFYDASEELSAPPDPKRRNKAVEETITNAEEIRDMLLDIVAEREGTKRFLARIKDPELRDTVLHHAAKITDW